MRPHAVALLLSFGVAMLCLQSAKGFDCDKMDDKDKCKDMQAKWDDSRKTCEEKHNVPDGFKDWFPKCQMTKDCLFVNYAYCMIDSMGATKDGNVNWELLKDHTDYVKEACYNTLDKVKVTDKKWCDMMVNPDDAAMKCYKEGMSQETGVEAVASTVRCFCQMVYN